MEGIEIAAAAKKKYIYFLYIVTLVKFPENGFIAEINNES